MNASRPVQADPQKEVIALEEAGPFFIDERAVRLQGIANIDGGDGMLHLKAHHFLEEVQPRQQRPSALPGEGSGPVRPRHIFLDEFLQQSGIDPVNLGARLAHRTCCSSNSRIPDCNPPIPSSTSH